MATAILIDGDFFIRRCRFLVGKQPALKAAADLHWMCREHLKQPERKRDLYRIFFHWILDPMWATIRPDLHEHIPFCSARRLHPRLHLRRDQRNRQQLDLP